MPNPYGGYQVGTLPGQRGAPNGVTGPAGSSSGPVMPSDNLLVATSALPGQFTINATERQQLDNTNTNNRLSISVQNIGPGVVEIFPGVASPTFGQGIQVAVGQLIDFAWTEAVKVYAICASGQTADVRIVQNFKN